MHNHKGLGSLSKSCASEGWSNVGILQDLNQKGVTSKKRHRSVFGASSMFTVSELDTRLNRN